MRNIHLETKGSVDHMLAERVARQEAAKAGMENAEMVAWYDHSRNMAGPLETCAKEGWKCARDYAEHHGAGLRVSVDHDEYEFFFSDVSPEFTEFDREEALGIHADARRDDFDDVQGG